jgi:hypothetical protein
VINQSHKDGGGGLGVAVEVGEVLADTDNATRAAD